MERLITPQAAARAGLTPSTWRSWRTRGLPRGNPIPPPDGHYDGRTPWWWDATVDAWNNRRPKNRPDQSTEE